MILVTSDKTMVDSVPEPKNIYAFDGGYVVYTGKDMLSKRPEPPTPYEIQCMQASREMGRRITMDNKFVNQHKLVDVQSAPEPPTLWQRLKTGITKLLTGV